MTELRKRMRSNPATPPCGDLIIREALDVQSRRRFRDLPFRLYRDGEYALARANLERALERNLLSSTHEARAREIMAFCLVAMERPKDAEHEFVRLLMVDPKRTLDPVTTSPKIMEVFQRAAKGGSERAHPGDAGPRQGPSKTDKKAQQYPELQQR